MQCNDLASVARQYKPMLAQTHKNLQGHALLIGGSAGKMGAITLAAMAAMRSGCGKVTTFIPKSGNTMIQTVLPEVMSLFDENESHLTQFPTATPYEAVGVGPGLGMHPNTIRAFNAWSFPKKLVIDADALHLLAERPLLWAKMTTDTVLTPHAGEWEHLSSISANCTDYLIQSQQWVQQHPCILVLKGAPTHIITPTDIIKNTTGHCGQATAGSGDTLTGLLTGLLAQGYSPIDAACLGVYIHGRAAELALAEQSTESFIASDGIRYFGQVFKEIGAYL